MLKSIGDKPLVVLRNHGLLAWGANVPQTFATLWTAQRACDVQVASQGLNDELINIPQHVLEQTWKNNYEIQSSLKPMMPTGDSQSDAA